MKPHRPPLPLIKLAEAACLAPSGDNTQPWRLVVHAEPPERGGLQQAAGPWQITVQVDPQRDRSPMNAGQRMARLAVGAAAENMVLTARSWGWTATIHPQEGCGLSVLVDPTAAWAGEATTQTWELPAAIVGRATNRRMYTGGEIEPATAEALSKVEELPGTRVAWVLQRKRVAALARRIGDGDGILFGLESARRAFLEQIRFDRPAREAVAEGLSLGSLEAGAGEKLALRLLRWMPQWVFQGLGLGRVFARRAAELVCSASGLCLIVTQGWEAASDFAVGRQMERAWLALTEQGLAVQPMMSLPVLENMVQEEVIEASSPLAQRVRQLARELCLAVGGTTEERVAAVLRFGWAKEPTGRVGRRPVEEVAEVGGAAEATGLVRAGAGEG